MKTKLLFLVCISISSLAYTQDKDLQVISSASKSFEAGNVSLEWTLGEVVVDYFDQPSMGLTQGFHQPAYQLVSVKPIPAELGIIAVFPNPFSDELLVKMTFAELEKGDMELLDLKGTSIWKKSFEGNEVLESYSASALPSGSYFLVVSLDNDTIVQSYQISKTQ
jgi:hypothetical protein